MKYKTKLEHDLYIVSIVMVVVGLAAIITSVVLRFTLGPHNMWTEGTFCVAMICALEANYSNGYLKGLAYKTKGE